MQRRELLATVGSALLAGCTGVFGEHTPTVTPAPVPATPTTRPPPTTTARPRYEGRDCHGAGARLDAAPRQPLPDPPARYADLGCPTVEWADRTVCSHTADLAAAPAVLVARRHLADLVGDRGARLEFVLVNQAGPVVDLRFRTSTWAVLAAGRGEWSPVALGQRGCRRTMGNSWAHWWHVGVNTEPDSARAVNETATRVDLSPGTYGFAVPANVVGGPSVLCVAPFTVRRIVGATGGSQSNSATEASGAQVSNRSGGSGSDSG